jgi:hypothetical protein
MSLTKVFAILFFYCLSQFVLTDDNLISSIKPYDGPDPGYILAESNSGLSNRLRVLAAFIYIGEKVYNGAHTVFIWDKNTACPGHFLSIFEPIDGVIFATNSSKYVLDKNAKMVYANSTYGFRWIMQAHGVPKNRFGLPTWGDIERRMYSKFFPVREIMLKVSRFVKEHNICNSSAMHMRTTDLDKVMNPKKRTNINAYFKYVESRPAEEKVFLLTDDPKTQRLMLQKYGPSKIVVYSIIAEVHEQPPLFVGATAGDTEVAVSSSFVGGPAGSNGSFTGVGVAGADKMSTNAAAAIAKLADDHRFTSLEHTLIDVIIAAHAKHFRGAAFSSLSELVTMFEGIGKKDRGWCSNYVG